MDERTPLTAVTAAGHPLPPEVLAALPEEVLRSLHSLGEGCGCVSEHCPKTYVPALHHIVPQSWGGQTVLSNLVLICPNAHTSTHRLLDEYVRHYIQYGGDGDPGWEVRRQFSPFVRDLATRGWAGHPPTPTITSMAGGHW